MTTIAELVVAPVQRPVVACEVYQSGTLVAEPRVTGGSVTADARRSIMRDATIEFAPDRDLALDELWALLVTPGTTVALSRGFRLADGSDMLVPLGRFVPDAPELKRGPAGSALSLAATDIAIKIQRARWADPYQIASGTTLASALSELLRDRYPQVETAITTDICPETMGAGLVTEAGDGSDPWADAVSLAGAFG
jgi:hypothetical protein